MAECSWPNDWVVVPCPSASPPVSPVMCTRRGCQLRACELRACDRAASPQWAQLPLHLVLPASLLLGGVRCQTGIRASWSRHEHLEHPSLRAAVGYLGCWASILPVQVRG